MHVLEVDWLPNNVKLTSGFNRRCQLYLLYDAKGCCEQPVIGI